MSRSSISLSSQLQDYLVSHSVKPNKVKEELRQRTAELQECNMQISAEQGQFMAVLARLVGAKKAIEVGTFTGYSALCVAEVLPEDGRLIACDVNADWTTIAEEHWQKAGVDHKIDLRLHPAVETMQELIDRGEAGTFNMAFIDADKVNYKNYYELALKLLRKGGVIAVDNVLWSGAVVEPTQAGDESTQGIKEFNDYIFADQRVEMCILPISDGLTLAYKI